MQDRDCSGYAGAGTMSEDKTGVADTGNDIEPPADNLATAVRELSSLLRRLHHNPEILAIEQVARLMRCSVDTVRRIPTDQLLPYRVSKENLYFLQDVMAFVRSRPARRSDIELVIAEVLHRVEQPDLSVLSSGSVDARRRS